MGWPKGVPRGPRKGKTMLVNRETGEVEEHMPPESEAQENGRDDEDDGLPVGDPEEFGGEDFPEFQRPSPPSLDVMEEVRQSREAQEPVSNKEHLPLFPTSKDKKPQKRVEGIKVIKLTPPNDGYKGRIGPDATEDYVGRRWGDGTYKFVGVNGADIPIVTRTDVVISMSDDSQKRETVVAPANDGIKMDDVRRLLLERDQKNEMALKAEREHQQRLAKESEDRGKQFIALIEGTRKSELENTRLFMQQQQQMAQQAHSQQMQMMQAGFNQTVQMMQAAAQQNNPLVMLKIFQEGMQMAQGFEQDDTDPALRAIEVAVGGLKELKDIALTIPKKNKAVTSNAGGTPDPKKLAKSNQPNGKPNPSPNGSATRTEDGKRKLSDDERKKIAAFVALCDQKGVDLPGLLDQAAVQVGSLPDDDGEDDDADAEGTDGGPSDEGNAPPVTPPTQPGPDSATGRPDA